MGLAQKNRLLEAAFHQGPIFRQGFDQHVRAWKRHVGEQAFAAYHNEPEFAAAFAARQAELRAMPMPEWKS